MLSVVVLERPGFASRAALLSESLGLPLLNASDDLAAFDMALTYDQNGLSIELLHDNSSAVRVDFLSGANRHRLQFGGGKGQQLAKALGLDRKGFDPVIFDMTAGLGRDSFVMASLGGRVQMIERHPIVFALLKDGLERAIDQAEQEEKVAGIVQRMNCLAGEAEQVLSRLTDSAEYPDICYLDPMFPPRNKSAKVKKEMQLFHQLVGFDEHSDNLLEAALQKTTYRVVVKRPAHAPHLAEKKPSISFKGKSTRFDVYSLKKIPG